MNGKRNKELVSDNEPFMVKSDIKPVINEENINLLKDYVSKLEHRLTSTMFLNPSIRFDLKAEIKKVNKYIIIASINNQAK